MAIARVLAASKLTFDVVPRPWRATLEVQRERFAFLFQVTKFADGHTVADKTIPTLKLRD
ncbi:MAG: hypothetical protein GC190_16590 [Alphaproteobacteria bacterium]|nr:hypothetical protein [Alphaproteobacteria bacterium]